MALALRLATCSLLAASWAVSTSAKCAGRTYTVFVKHDHHVRGAVRCGTVQCGTAAVSGRSPDSTAPMPGTRRMLGT